MTTQTNDPPYQTDGLFHLIDTMNEPELVIEPFGVRGQLVTLTANPGHGKSTLCLTYAVHHVLERPLGPLRPASDGCVCYICAEDITGTCLRGAALRGALRLGADDVAIVNKKLIVYEPLTQRSPQMIAEDIRTDYPDTVFDVVIVDVGPALFFGAEENSNVELQVFAQQCRALTTLPGRPLVLLLWHPVKNAGADNLSPRGASALTGTIDGNLTLWRQDDSIELSYTKIRTSHFDPMRFALNDAKVIWRSGKVYTLPIAEPIGEDKIEARDDATRERRERVLFALSQANGERLSLRALAKDVLGNASRSSTVRDHLRLLTRTKPPLVEQDPVSEQYGLTKAGKAHVASLRAKTAAAYRAAADPE